MRNLIGLLVLCCGCWDANLSRRPGLMIPDAGSESEAESEAESEGAAVPDGGAISADANVAHESEAESESEAEAEAESESESESEGQPCTTNDDCGVGGGCGCVDSATLRCTFDTGRCLPTGFCEALDTFGPPPAEVCDGIDNNCDGAVDEIFRTGDCYSCDGTLRVFGIMACQPDGTNACSDTTGVPLVSNSEACGCLDLYDNDFDGARDCDDPDCSGEPQCVCPNGTEQRWRDNDGDGYGDPNFSAIVCADAPPVEGVTNADDCDDTYRFTHPGVAEFCDGRDNDCNPATPDGASEFYLECYIGGVSGCDFRNNPTCIGACQTGFEQCVTGNIECVGAVTPVAEICLDGLDNDCDRTTDDDCACTTAADCPPSGNPAFEPYCHVGFGCEYVLRTACATATDCSQLWCAESAFCRCLPNEGGPCYTGGDGNDGCQFVETQECRVGCDQNTPGCCHTVTSARCDGECRTGVTACTASGMRCDDEVVPITEVCNDNLDNDCDGMTDCVDPDCASVCPTACAPLFTLDPATPAGASVPGISEVLRVRVTMPAECQTVIVRNLTFRVTNTDNANSGWGPGLMRLYYDFPRGTAYPAGGFGIRDTQWNWVFRFRLGLDGSEMEVEPNTTNYIQVWLDTTGASTTLHDTVRVNLAGTVEYVNTVTAMVYDTNTFVMGQTISY